MHWTRSYRWPMLCVAPRCVGAKEALVGRIGGLLLAVLGLAPARFTDDFAPVGNIASSGAEGRPLLLAWRRRRKTPTAALACPRAVRMKIAVSDARADVLVSLFICDERSTRRRQ
jgi:hypothetical protein